MRSLGEARDVPSMVVLAATDPAQPYGASLRWPDSDGRPQRSAGAHVVLLDGELAVFVERGGKSLVSFPALRDEPQVLRDPRWVEGLKELLRKGMVRNLEVAKIDGQKASESPLYEVLIEQGFVRGYKGLTWVAPRS